MFLRIGLCLGLLAASSYLTAQQLTESFDGATVPPTGWTSQNNSDNPTPGIAWEAGFLNTFAPHQGAQYLGASTQATQSASGSETVSVWLITPALQLANGVVINFWTRTHMLPIAGDRMQVRVNATNTTNVGSTPTSVGDFSNLLLDINPTYATGGAYPNSWTAYSLVVSGVTGTVTGRVAFRYFIENAGNNGSYVGLDTLSIGDVPGNPEVDVQIPLGTTNSVADGASYDYTTPLLPGSAANSFSFAIVNQGASNSLSVSGFATGSASGCAVSTVTGPPGTIAAGGNATVTLSIGLAAFTAYGTFSFEVSFTTNDVSETNYNFTVQGRRGLAGTYTISNAGGADFNDFGAAFNALEDIGVAGPVIFNVADTGTQYTPNADYELGTDGMQVPAPRPVYGTSVTNTVTFQPGNGRPVISNVGGGGCTFNYLGIFSGIGMMTFTNVGHVTFRGMRFQAAAVDWVCLQRIEPDMLRAGPVNFVGNEFIGPGSFSGAALVFMTLLTAQQPATLVQNNIFSRFGVSTGAYGGAPAGLGIAQGVVSFYNPGPATLVEHNTIMLDAGTTGNVSCVYSVQGRIGTVRYNILHNPVAGEPVFGMQSQYTPTASNRNVIYTTNGAVVHRNFATLASWQSTGLDASSTDANPNFVNAATPPLNLHISAGSSAIDLAQGSTVAIDFDGESRPVGTHADAGADEFTGGPQASLTVIDASAAEHPANTETGEFRLNLSVAAAGTLVIPFTMSGTASAVPGADYSLSTTTAGASISFTGPGGTITVPASTTQVSVILTPFDDLLLEGGETAIMTLGSGTGFALGAPSFGTITITDNDAPTATLSVTDSSAAEQGQATGTWQLSFSASNPAATTVNFTMTGTASTSPGTDYSLSTTTAGASIAFSGPGGTITFPASTLNVTIVLTPNDDSVVESSETAIMTITGGTNYNVCTPAAGTITILDNDIAASVLVFDSGAAENAANTETGEVRVVLSGAAAVALTVNFTMSGSASTVPGTDYSLSTPTAGASVSFTGPGGTVTIPAGTTSVSIILTPFDDMAVESAETATLTLNSGSGYSVGTPNNGTVTIADNDGTGAPVVSVAASGSIVENGTVDGVFTLTASPVPGGTITVTIALSGTATLGADYNASATLTVNIGPSGSATVTITPIDDTLVESTENVVLTVQAGVGYTVGTPAQASMNITDDEAPPSPISGGGGGSGGGGCTTGQPALPAAMLALLALAVLGRKRRKQA